VANTLNDNASDDLFESIIRARALAPPGQYVGALTTFAPFATARTSGYEVTIRVTEGRHRDRIIRLRIILDGPVSLDGLIGANVETLEQWWREVGVETRPLRSGGFGPVFKQLWRGGQGKRLLFKIGVRGEGRFVENVLLGVTWDFAGALGIRP
jgi:hypothetical protein